MNHSKSTQVMPAPPAPPARNEDKPIRLRLQLRWEGLFGRHAARLYALSRAGCYIETLGQVKAGEFVWFEMQSPTGRWLQLQWEVIRARHRVGFSLRFLGLSEHQTGVVGELVEYARAVSAPPLPAPAFRQAA